MNLLGHSIVATIALALLLSNGFLQDLGGTKQLLLFSMSFIVFSMFVSPDIDTKIPYLAHRGVTHNWKGLILISAILVGIIYFALPRTMEQSWTTIAIPVAFGAVLAWFVHIIVDMLYDKIRWILWLLIVLLVMYVYWIY